MQGTIRTIKTDKGFGFIRGSDHMDYFFHRNHVERPLSFDTLHEGDKVSFEGREGVMIGLRAEQVTMVGRRA